MRILVIGARGFVGLALTRELLTRGHDVVAIEPRPDKGMGPALPGDVEWHAGSCADAENVLTAIGRKGVGAIYYGPFYRSPSRERNLSAEFEVMGRGALAVFNLARVLDIRRIVFPSSIAVHGVQTAADGQFDEDSPVRPFGVYGATKLLCEKLAEEVNAEIGCNVVTALRLGSIYGPGADIASRRVNVIPVQAARGAAGRVDYVPEARVCLGHVDDTATAIANAMETPVLDRTVYGLGGLDQSFADIEAATRALIPEAGATYGTDTVSPLPFAVSSARAAAAFGMRHRSLADGVRSIVEYERRRG